MPVLQIVIAGHCFGCEEAERLYREVVTRFPGLSVELIDLDVKGRGKPKAVVAVPSFLLDGKVLFVGNPFPEELFAKLSSLQAGNAG